MFALKCLRIVRDKKLKKVVGSERKLCFSNYKRNIRKTLNRGLVLILLAGRHKGKRIVLLKVYSAELIATKTRSNVKNIKLPNHIINSYFRRVVKKKNT
ncbi:60S ribosomal protein L6-like [Sabethes cyaneus]|uniref:60S ribosomal protein L6-like n=1 Tax=Sabethes cyaneus TaxID=53552 RepID=UPI00237D557B|nr:60S ribosomal protein L6-like [Sabethes cyaneus]